MAQQTDTQLQTLADQIKNEVVPAANTATRVGTLFGDLVDSKLNTGSISTNTALGTSDGLVPSQNAVRTYVSNVSSSIAVSIASVSSSVASIVNPKIYAAVLTHNGINGTPPAAVVAVNTLGFTPTWVYLADGIYFIQELFDYRYTTFTIGGSIYTSPIGTVQIYGSDAGGNSIQIYVNTTSDIVNLPPADGLLYKTPIEIRVYQ